MSVTPKRRSTVDIVIIILATTVCATITFAALGTIIGKIWNPLMDVTRAAEIIANTITTILGALVGFIGGRAAGRLEANGRK